MSKCVGIFMGNKKVVAPSESSSYRGSQLSRVYCITLSYVKDVSRLRVCKAEC